MALEQDLRCRGQSSLLGSLRAPIGLWHAATVADEPLLDVLSHLAALLEKHGEHWWSKVVREDPQQLRSGYSYALDHLLSAFGGMGSLSDLVLHPINGHDVSEANIEVSNEQLAALLERVWSEASELRRSLNQLKQ